MTFSGAIYQQALHKLKVFFEFKEKWLLLHGKHVLLFFFHWLVCLVTSLNLQGFQNLGKNKQEFEV